MIVEGDNVRVGRDEFVVMYLACSAVWPVVNVVGGRDVRRVWTGNVNDFHGTTNVPISPAGQFEVDDLIHGAKGPCTDATLDKVPVSNCVSDERGFGIDRGQVIRRSGKGHSEARQVVPGKRCGSAWFIRPRCTSGDM